MCLVWRTVDLKHAICTPESPRHSAVVRLGAQGAAASAAHRMSIGAPVSAESLLAWLVRVSPIRAKQVGDMARWLNRGAPHQQRRLSRFARCKWTRMKQMICLKGLSAKHQLAVQPPKRRRRRWARYA